MRRLASLLACARASGGARVFCMDIAEPFPTATTYVAVRTLPAVRALSGSGMLLLAMMLVAAGLLAGRRRHGHNAADRTR